MLMRGVYAELPSYRTLDEGALLSSRIIRIIGTAVLNKVC
jgi:hypothetical protein